MEPGVNPRPVKILGAEPGGIWGEGKNGESSSSFGCYLPRGGKRGRAGGGRSRIRVE